MHVRLRCVTRSASSTQIVASNGRSLNALECRCTLEDKRPCAVLADGFGICASGRIVVDQSIEAIRAWPTSRLA
ncbi:hypothetical protein WS69_28855 [Burkholderia sp. BDU5]|nr:hypothetical protein WS69_28855 [Burkholderia sp. BDU5]